VRGSVDKIEVLLLAMGAVCCAFCCLAEEPGTAWRRHVIDDSSRGADGVKLADLNNDGLMEITTGWEQGGVTRVYFHPGYNRAAQRWPAVTVGKTPSVEDAVFIDLDSDDVLEVVACCQGRCRSIFVHRASKSYGHWEQHVLPASRDKMAWMFAMPMQVDGRCGPDLLAAGKGPQAAIGWFESPEDPRALEKYRWHRLATVGWVMSIIVEDMDGDDDADIVFSDRKGRLSGCRWLENPGPGRASSKWTEHLIGGRGREVMFMTLADLDGDGLKDAVAAVKPAEVLWFRRLDESGRSWMPQEIPYPENTGSAKAVAVGDLNLDGKAELVLSCEHAPAPRSGVVWMSPADDPADPWHRGRISGPEGEKFDRIELIDIDGDGDLDVLTCEEARNLGVFWYENPALPLKD